MAAASPIAWNVVAEVEKTLWSGRSPSVAAILAHILGLRKGKRVYTSRMAQLKLGGSWWSLNEPPRHKWSMSAWQCRCCRKRFMRSDPARSSSELFPRTLESVLCDAGSSRMRNALASSLASSSTPIAHCSMRSDCSCKSLDACTSVTRLEMRLHRYEPSSAMCTGFSECVQKTCTSCSLPCSTAHIKRSRACRWRNRAEEGANDRLVELERLSRRRRRLEHVSNMLRDPLLQAAVLGSEVERVRHRVKRAHAHLTQPASWQRE
eukprot:5099904-Prymnesium_polylepis.1